MENKRYDLILFDADDTLFNFQKSESAAFQLALAEYGTRNDVSELYSAYKEISFGLWQKLEKNEISKDRLKVERFERLFEQFSISYCANSMSDTYLNFLPKEVHLIEGAFELCLDLSKEFEVGIVTNGIDSVQKERLERSGLSDFISFMVVSEECGYPKPDRRFFDYTFTKTKHQPRNSILVGDRLETDILGANNADIDSCWFNPEQISCNTDIKPKYEISRLSELRSLLLM